MLIGWLWGWVITVQYTDANLSSLSDQYQKVHLTYVADSYAAGNTKLDDLAKRLGEGWSKQQIIDKLNEMIKPVAPGADRLSKLSADLASYSGDIWTQLRLAPPAHSG